MKWLRLYHEALNDPKMREIAVEAEEPVYAVMAVWMAILIKASEATPRGIVQGWSHRTIGASLDLKGARVEAIYTAMQGIILDGDKVIAWEKRQFATDDAAARKRAFRSKGSESDGTRQTPNVPGQNENVPGQTPDVTGHPLRATELQITDIKKEDIPGRLVTTPCHPTDRPTDLIAIFDEILIEMGVARPVGSRRDAEIGDKWRKIGVSPECLRAVMTEQIPRAFNRGVMPRCPSLIDADVIREHHRRNPQKGLKNGDTGTAERRTVADRTSAVLELVKRNSGKGLGQLPGGDDVAVLPAVSSG